MNNYKTVESKKIFQTPIFDLFEDRITLPSGQEITKAVLKHPGASVFIPQVDDNHLILIRQYRYAVRSSILEFPAGIIDPGESPLECAQREMSEETGHGAKKWTELGCFYSSPGFCNEKLYGFLGRELFEKTAPADEAKTFEEPE